ncbi:MAG: UPF0280 family protein [Candidatus Margulisbacteria bacterium]|nr:UPF0280 family protein [Candidatus Margulisiibacteriota bacterium]
MVYQERAYRNYIKAEELVRFELVEKETDLLIQANSNLYDKAMGSVIKHRGTLEQFIESNPKFLRSLSPVRVSFNAPPIIKLMAAAAKKMKVGPMAAVAGAIAELVGRDLLQFTDELIIENGGDIYLRLVKPRKLTVYAGDSPFSEKILVELDPQKEPFAISMTSGHSGRSVGFGKGDLVMVVSRDAPLADAASTAINNVIKDAADIDSGLAIARKTRGLDGVLIIKDDQMGMMGKIKLISA